jgi:putative radical SAM enzyme (TIGR03279 family)
MYVLENRGLAVAAVEPDSIAEEIGVEPGDRIISVNQRPVNDIIDYRFLSADENILIRLEKPDGEKWELEIEKDFDEDIGVDFGPEGLGRTKRCGNKCIFCFVEQMPPAMRESLYVKDDDYRLSFLQGNFITLTNTGDGDLQRIISQRLSPLYVSVHTTHPDLRMKMMGNPGAGKILDIIRQLTLAGIEIHAQAVLCPGVNDGEELRKTVHDLTALWPGVRSLALVPVGITRYRKGLYPLHAYNKEQALEIIRMVEGWQNACVKAYGCPLVYAGDEFYLLSGLPVPQREKYADFPQIENGVGLVRLFQDSFSELERQLPVKLAAPLHVTLVTGKLAESILRPMVGRLNGIGNLKVELAGVENNFFGKTVTVAGLLTAGDIAAKLKSDWETPLAGARPDLVVIPQVMLRSGEDIFLDNMTVSGLQEALGIEVKVAGGPEDLLDIIMA